MSTLKIQKSAWLIVTNPSAVNEKNSPVYYYRDTTTFGTGVTTKSFMNAWWFDTDQEANSKLKALRSAGKNKKEIKDAEVKRLVIGLQ